MRLRYKSVVGLSSILAAGLFAACGTDDPVATEQSETRDAAGTTTVETGSSSEKQAPSTSPRDDRGVGAAEAIRVANASVEGGKVFDLELDRTGGRVVWDLDVASGNKEYEIRIDARTGKVLEIERDRTPDAGVRLIAASNVSAARAARIAEAAVPGAKLRDLELERSHGRMVWEAELAQGHVEYDIVIDAGSGKVLSKRIDD